jgi:hypothetical protein
LILSTCILTKLTNQKIKGVKSMANPIAFAERPTRIVVALLFGVALLLPAFLSSGTDAAQIEDRFIQISNSATSATGVEYTIQFDVPSTTTIEAIVIDICQNSPLIGVACTAPAAFDWGTPTISSATIGATDISGWTESTLNSGRTFTTLTTGAGVTPAANAQVTIVVTGVANPSQLGTFYGRMITISDDSSVAGYLATDGDTHTGYIDVGGAAMSTTDNLVVTARVQETLQFCVYSDGPIGGNTCGTESAVNVPDAVTPLNSTGVETAEGYFKLASNALNGVTVRMWSNNGSGGVLKSGTYTIDAFAGAACAADSTTATVEQFGMRFSTLGANLAAVAPYDCAAGNHGWDPAAVGATYGDIVATTNDPNDAEESVMEFAAKSALTTEAGVYSTALNYIATGSY